MRAHITIKKPEEIALIREGGKLLGRILDELTKMVAPGITTADLERYAEERIKAVGGRPSFKGYGLPRSQPFLTVLCASVNEEVVHAPALPARVLNKGDIIGIDIGMEYPNAELRAQKPEFKHLTQGFYNDTAVTVGVGRISSEAKRLIEVTQRALEIGIKAVKPGRLISDISRAIEKYGQKQDVGIVRDLVGHGVGYTVHEDPPIPNYYDERLPEVTIQENMVLAIEPMFTLGDWRIVLGPDGWTIKSADNSLAAHFEHTIIVNKNGAEIATKVDLVNSE